MPTNEELIKQMYDGHLAGSKAQLEQQYQQADAALSAQKEQNAQATDQNLTRTAVEGQKAAMNMAQLHDAQGLSSGARAQARLSLENQTAANMTALRAAQQQSDADLERERTLLAQEYASAIAKAESDNDLQKAQALYEQAKVEEERLLSNQLAAAKLMAEAGDYSMLGQLYGLTDAQLGLLQSGGNKVPDGYTVTNKTGDGWVAIGNGRLTDAELQQALLSGRIIRVLDADNKTITYEYAHSGVTGEGAHIDGTGSGGTENTPYPQQQTDGSFLIDGEAMTLAEVYEAVKEGTLFPKQDATGAWTFHKTPPGTVGSADDRSFGNQPMQNAVR